MSYCRWSSDNWQCDVYAYEADYGIVVDVAQRHRMFDPVYPYPLDSLYETLTNQGMEAAQTLMDRQQLAVDHSHWIPLNPRYAGKNYYNLTKYEAANLLKTMKENGIHIPNSAIETLNQEARDQA